jgi:hypothetical protein
MGPDMSEERRMLRGVWLWLVAIGGMFAIGIVYWHYTR